jgi:putative MATE family efflux protein
MPFFIFCIAIGDGTGVGANALASRRFGERNIDSANRVAGQTFFLALLLGAVLLLATNLFPRQILMLSGATPDVLEFGEAYLRVLGWGMPFLFFSMIARNVFQASGDAIRPMIFTITAQVVNAVLDPFFIFGWSFFPEMGIAGAALATVIANGVSAVLSVWYIMSPRTVYRIRLHHSLPHLPTIFGIYRIGLPSILMSMTESVVFALFNRVIAGFGSVALAAVGVAGRIADLAFMPIVGTAHGLLPVIGFCFGARLWPRLWRAVRLTTIAMAVLMAIATIALEIFAMQVVSLFSHDPELIAIAVPGMRIFLSTMVLIGPTIMFITTFQGLSKGKDAMFLSLARQFIFFVPALYGLTHFMGITGVWLSMPVSDILGTLTSGLWLLREYRRQKKGPAWAEAQTGHTSAEMPGPL